MRLPPLTAVMLAFGVLAGAPVSAQTPAPSPSVPNEGMHHVDAAGNAVAVEVRLSRVESKRSTFYCYLDGPTSDKAFATSDTHRFVTRELQSRDDIRKGKLPSYKLEELAVKDGRRYGTKAFVDIDIVRVGEPEFGADPDRKKDRGWVTFALTPRIRLAPGEYAFSTSGLVTMIAGFSPVETLAYAFRIDAAPAAPSTTTRVAPPTAPAAPTTAAAPTPPAAPSGSPTSLPAIAAPSDAIAQYNLGVQFRDGTGVPKDPALAATLFRQAAEQGLGQAQANLGYLYATGSGVPQDFVLAYQWLNLGASRLSGKDQEQMAAMRDQVASRMTPAQVAEGQKLAREWFDAFTRRTGAR